MRIGLVIYGSLDTPTGGYLYDRMLVDHLRHAGHEVRVFSMAWGSYARRLLGNANLRLAQSIRNAGLDVLLEDELNHPSLVALNRILRRRGQPVVAIVHHLGSQEEGPRRLAALPRAVEREYLRGVDAFIYNSRATREAVVALVGSRAPGFVAHPGGDRLGSAPTADRIRSRAQQAGPLEAIFLGAVTRRKGLHALIEALARLEPGLVRLRVVGDLTRDPGYVRRLRERAGELGLHGRVQWLGRLKDEDLAELMSAAHILAVPSSLEGFGISYLEGMAHGLPSLAASAGGAREIVEDGVTGYLLRADDANGVVDALRRLASDRELLARMGLAARQAFMAQPTWPESLESIHRFIMDVARTSADGRARLRLGPQPTWGGLS
jgi:glycosyltransferase involved in cell wall biosynthesis